MDLGLGNVELFGPGTAERGIVSLICHWPGGISSASVTLDV